MTTFLLENKAEIVGYNWEDFKCEDKMDIFSFDMSLAHERNDAKPLIKFINSYYDQGEDFTENSCKYHKMIKEAIKQNNLMAFEVLTDGICYHDRDHADYGQCLIWGAKYGSLKTFKHILYTFVNSMNYNGRQQIFVHKIPVEFNNMEEVNIGYCDYLQGDTLVGYAQGNPDKDVLEYVKTLETKKDGTLGYEEYDPDDYDDEEENESDDN